MYRCPAGGAAAGVTVFAVIPTRGLLRVRDLVILHGQGKQRFLTPVKSELVRRNILEKTR